MIDTIVLRIHNKDKYTKLIETLRNSGQNIGLKQDIWLNDNINFNQSFLQIVETQFFDSNKVNVRMTDKVYLPSSHYLLAWSAQSLKNYIEFNFSIPKLIYGTNVIQFIRHLNENQGNDFFDFSRQCKMSKNMTDTYDRLIFFLKRFFILFCQWSEKDYTGKDCLFSVDQKDVEINRIDICFNQIFDTEKEALDYLELQKDLRKKYEKDNSKSSRGWKTSIWMRTDRYTAKIYHKGTEYATNDLKHHLKINKTAKRQVFDIKSLQALADRTLRYEISFKNAYLSYIFKTKLFRKKDKFFEKMRENANFIKATEDKIKRKRNQMLKLKKVYERQPTDQKDLDLKAQIYGISDEMKKLERKMNEYINLSYVNRRGVTNEVVEKRCKLAIIYHNMISLNTKFFMKISKDDQLENEKTIGLNVRETSPQIIQTALFSRELLNECNKVFKDFFKQFQIKERKDFKTLEILIDEYNKRAKSLNLINETFINKGLEKKIQLLNVSSLVNVWENLRNNSWEIMEQKGIIKRSSVYRYKKIFLNLGIQKNEFSPIPLNPSLDFEKYHQLILHGSQINTNNIFFY